MKKNIIGILVVIVLITSITCVVAESQSSLADKDFQTISKNGISIKFPLEWGISKSSSNCSLIAISNLASIDSNGVAQVNINIEKKPVEGDFNKFVNKSYTLMSKTGNYSLVSSGNVSTGKYNGLMFTYNSNINGTVKTHEAIWIEHNKDAYVLLFSAPKNQFDSNVKVFDYVVHSFTIN